MQPRGGPARRVKTVPASPFPGDDPEEVSKPGRGTPANNGSFGGGASNAAASCSLRWLCVALVVFLALLHGMLTLQRIGQRTDAIQMEMRDTERFIGSIAKHKQLTVNVDPVPTIIAAPAKVTAAPAVPAGGKPVGKPAGGTVAKTPTEPHPMTNLAPSDPPEESVDAEGVDWPVAGGGGASGGSASGVTSNAPANNDPKAPVLEHHAPFTKPPGGFQAQAAGGNDKKGGLPTVEAPPTESPQVRAARERLAAQNRARQNGGRLARTKQPPPPTDVIGRAGDITERTINAMRTEAKKADDVRAQPWLTDRPRNEDGSPKFRIAVLTLNAKNVQRSGKGGQLNKRPDWMHGHSYHNKQEYCKRWGYDFIVEDNAMVDRSRDVAWSKIPIFRKWLPFYDYVMWMDMDAFFMRYEIPLESIVTRDETKDIVIAKDFHGINFGVFFFKSTQFTAELMELMWNAPRHWWQPWQEQSALMKLTDKKYVGAARAEELNKHFLYVPQRDMNAYPQHFSYGNLISHYRDGDFIVHFPNCKAFPMCKTIIDRFYTAACKYNDVGPEAANAPPVQHPATDASKRADWSDRENDIVANAARTPMPLPPTTKPAVIPPQTIRVVAKRPLRPGSVVAAKPATKPPPTKPPAAADDDDDDVPDVLPVQPTGAPRVIQTARPVRPKASPPPPPADDDDDEETTAAPKTRHVAVVKHNKHAKKAHKTPKPTEADDDEEEVTARPKNIVRARHTKAPPTEAPPQRSNDEEKGNFEFQDPAE